ncbi:MAG: hypothetical protein K9G72_20450 [Rhodobacteraceae bacterium]|nr:hypothetical protein [Paracoccaceae bacterium]MCF8521024.1 hypothetical protein [Paracoccaceae bacterium]
MARVVLHIGTHKTATTTIQDMFAQNAELLAEHGIIYPFMGRATGHHGLVMDWNHALPPVYAYPDGALGTLRHIAEAYAGGDQTVFLSSEEFSRGRPDAQPDFTAIREALSGFDRIEVVCVLREQWQFIQSIYLEVSKSRLPARPPQVMDSALVGDMVEGLWTDYNLLYDHLLGSFASTEITFLDFDQCRQAPGGIIGTMLRHLGVALDPASLTLVNEGRSNASPGALPTWAANIIAEPGVAPRWLIEAVTGAFEVQFGAGAPSRIWTRDECSTLAGYAVRCNARLSERLSTFQPGFAVSRTDITAKSGIFREDIPPEFWVRANRWVFAAARRGSAS